MNFYSIKMPPANHDREQVFKVWPIQKLIAVVIFSSLSGFLIYLGYRGGYQANGVRLHAGICYWTGGVLAVFAALALSFAWDALGPDNWLLKVSTRRLLIKYRSYHNHHFQQEDPVIAEVPADGIEWIREVRETMTFPSTDEDKTFTSTFLDLKLSPKLDLLQIKEALHTERKRKPPGEGFTRGMVLHYPAQYVEPGILRLEWNGVHPGIKKALQILRMQYTLNTAENFRAREWDQLEGQEVEDRILDLAQRGRTIEAAHIAALKLNLSATEAVHFVNELTTQTPQ